MKKYYRRTSDIILSDEKGKNGIRFELKKVFEFLPDEINIVKVKGEDNTFYVEAPITKEQAKEVFSIDLEERETK